MSDTKLRCAVIFRIDPDNTQLLAKYDHASQYESHSGAASSDRDGTYPPGKMYL